MHQCKECGFVTADMTLVPSEVLADAYRVFCPKHDYDGARYLSGRPLTNDRCPQCEIEALKRTPLTGGMYKDLVEAKKQLAITQRAFEIATENYCKERAENFKGCPDTGFAMKQFAAIALAEFCKKHGG